MQWAGLIAPQADVLDVAAGGGRHSRFLADCGHKVTALDRDTSALALLPDIKIVEADLEARHGPFPAALSVRWS